MSERPFPLTPEEWQRRQDAARLPGYALARQLERLADPNTVLHPHEQAELLLEAAERLRVHGL